LDLIKDNLKVSLYSVLPIALIVLVFCLCVIPVDNGLLLTFLLGCVLLVVGMAFFNLGSDIAMTEIGNHIGAKVTKSRKIWLILIVSFILGISITIAEPCLQVLATNVPSIDSTTLILVVSLGVGLFLMLALMRIVFAFPIKYLLIIFYLIVFGFAAFSDKNYLSVSFDAGGVTTGPMTVPFIMSFGLGVSSIRSDANAKADSFGLIALCSVGPILSVMLLGFLYPNNTLGSISMEAPIFANTVSIGKDYFWSFPSYMREVALSLAPIFCFFILFQFISLKLNKNNILSIMTGIVSTYIGLVLFLTGANVGFSPLGIKLGECIGNSDYKMLLIPLGMLIGWFIINAEPSVYVLNKQVEEISAGAISAKSMGLSLSLAIALANGLAVVRVLTGISILWFLIPGYAISLILALFVPQTFTAIAFDSGGVASGPLTSAFMFPFVVGACNAVGGNVMTDAFGIVSMVAMTPLITVQIMGAISVIKSHKHIKPVEFVSNFADDEIIELWEVA